MAIQQAASGYELNLGEYWQIVRRRGWMILFCAVSMACFSWLFTWLNQPPPLYSSSASVKIEQDTNLADLLLQGGGVTRTDNMRTQLMMVNSYALMERVAKSMGRIPKDLTPEEIRANPRYLDEIMALKDDVSAEQESDTNIITITAVSIYPDVARDLAQTVADEFRTFNVEEKNRRVFEAKRFIQQQLVLVQDRLRKSEEAVRDFRQANHLSDIGANSQAVGNMVADFELSYRKEVQRLNSLRFALNQLRARVKSNTWDYQAVSMPDKVSTYFDGLNQRLVELALKHTELATDFTDQHPQMIELREQAVEILRSMVDELARQVQITNRRMGDIQTSIEATEKQYMGLPEQALELQRLKRTVRINEDLFDLLEKKYQEVLIKEAEKVQDVSVIRPAMLSSVRINPVRTAQTTSAGGILGLVLGLIIALILEAMDTSIGTIEEVESFLELPVIGFVPQLSDDEATELFSGVEGLATSGHELDRQIRLIAHFSPPSTISEAYRSLRTNLQFSQTGERRVILVTSATIKEGKSTIAANLAVVVAQQGARVLLIDADLRKPIQHRTFGIAREPGLSECLIEQIGWQDAVRRFSDVMLGDMGIDRALMTPGLDQLDILTSGRIKANPPDLLASPMMKKIMDEVRKEYDMVIIDMPPTLHTTDATILAPMVDGVLLVYHIGAVVRGALKRVKTSIENVGGHVMGLVLNGVRGEVTPDYAKYKMDRYYAYAYGERAKEPKAYFGGKAEEMIRKGMANIWRKARGLFGRSKDADRS
ncbi:MAG TPA: polysaccharide biosynthesis tyrosine autokinase [Mariprofundaceae bacterium]|nr:polysaccharide biosynthesis tyrosine autokinase [Mariprofundaceae bacterium]